MNVATISVTKQFGEYPAGRYRADGQLSGEAFRDDFLAPKLSAFEKVIIDLDGAMGYGSSFLEEAFGGLVRTKGFTVTELSSRLEFKSDDEPSLVDEIWMYINDAKPAT